MGEFTVSITRDYTFREGWGVHVEPLWAMDDDGEREWIESIEVDVVRIEKDSVHIVGGVACVATDMGFVPVENFQDVSNLTVDDTHDLRSRFFLTVEDATAHAEYTEKRFRNPSPWESFVQLS